jgi:hypothetical protein
LREEGLGRETNKKANYEGNTFHHKVSTKQKGGEETTANESPKNQATERIIRESKGNTKQDRQL